MNVDAGCARMRCLDARLDDLRGGVRNVRVVLPEYVRAGHGDGQDDGIAVPGARTARPHWGFSRSRHLEAQPNEGYPGHSSCHAVAVDHLRPERLQGAETGQGSGCEFAE